MAYLKSLELVGFKSFMEKTKLEFNPGITIIVGPNGCGKSNIVDAVKWVLGETSSKILRGTKMEDVIFNGTNQRLPLGMAEVSLTIDNTSYILPLSFSEITVTRRVFRSGESEFFINKTACRLKDITELFMDTGIGTINYSLMEQGKIEALINSKPEERRFIFEEAAGIMKYKVRKKEALKNLLDTENNLIRLRDIINEIKTQKNSLSRQATKALQYKECKEELKIIEIFLNYQNYKELQEKLISYNKTIENLTNKELEFSTYIENLTSQLENLRLDLITKEKDFLNLHKSFFELENHISKSENQVFSLNEKTTFLNKEKENSLKEIEAFKQKKEKIAEEIMHLKKEIEGIKEKKITSKSSKEEKTNFLKILEEKINRTKTKQVNLKEEIIDFLNKETSIKNEINFLIIQEEKNNKLIQNFLIKQQTLEKNISSLFKQIEVEEVLFKNSEEKKNTLEKNFFTIQEKEEKLQKQFLQLNEEIEEIVKNINLKQARLKSLEELQDRYEGFGQAVKFLMTEENSTIDKEAIVGIIGKLIKCAPEYEVAIEASLGEQLEDIIIGNVASAKSSIEYLIRENKGRVGFIPLDFIKTPKEKTLLPSTEILAKAKEVVSYEKDLEIIMEHLLGHVLLVKDLDTAINLSQKFDNTYKIVTLKGEIVEPGKKISGGSKNSLHSILKRKREIEILSEDLLSLEKEYKNFLKVKEETKKNLEKIEIAGKDIKTQIYNTELFILDKNKKLEALKTSREEKNKEITLLSQEIENINVENKEITLQKQKLENFLLVATNNSKESEKILENLSLQIKEEENELKKIMEEITNIRVNLNSLSEILILKEKELEKLNNLFSEIIQEKRKKEDYLVSLKHKEEEIKIEIIKLEKQKENFQKEKKEIEISLPIIEQDKKKLTDSIEVYEKELKDKRKLLLELQKELEQNKILASECEFKISAILERIKEEYDVSLLEVKDEEIKEQIKIEEDLNLQERIQFLKEKISKIGEINLLAIDEYKEIKDRFDFLISQEKDLIQSKDKFLEIIDKINYTAKKVFLETFEKVQLNFNEIFQKLFGGGKGELILLDEKNILETGIEIMARPPGKKLQNISLLSGGEKALIALVLLFAIFKIKSSPFCLLDEIDASLDDGNVIKFTQLLEEFTKNSQFIIISHNKKTISKGDILYGITMEEPGVSKIASVNLKNS